MAARHCVQSSAAALTESATALLVELSLDRPLRLFPDVDEQFDIGLGGQQFGIVSLFPLDGTVGQVVDQFFLPLDGSSECTVRF